MRFRFLTLHLFVFLGFAGVLARLGYLQLWRHGDLKSRAESQSSVLVRSAPRRGPILDRNGQTLAGSVRVASCYADPTLVSGPEAAAHRLAPILGLPAKAVAERIREARGSFVWLKRFLPMEQAQAVEAAKVRGVGLRWEYRRSYPDGGLAAPLLGFVGDDGKGLSGLELVMEDWLTDPRPPRRAFRDGRGAGLSLSPLEQEEERAWVRLTLDRTLQYIAERELDWGMKRSRAKAGQILIQDPWTGEILAAASRPQTLGASGRPEGAQGLTIPAAQWVFEPGSTFKLVTAAAALEEGLVRPHEVFSAENGKWKCAGASINDHEPKGRLTFAQAMEVSSNIVLAKVGLRLGRERFYDYIRAFGFGARTGSEIPGESSGILRPPSKWSGVSLPILSFGQEVGVTALQLAGAYSAVANGGALLEPRLYQEAQDAKGRKRAWEALPAVRRAVSEETARTLTGMLEAVVERGTGKEARLEGWTAAGKTGTAQKLDPRRGTYSDDKFVASFCGFAPASRPRLTIVVILDEPRGVEWGGYNAGPVFHNVAWHALTYLGVPTDEPAVLAERPVKSGRKT